jgi:hypothetical protein
LPQIIYYVLGGLGVILLIVLFSALIRKIKEGRDNPPQITPPTTETPEATGYIGPSVNPPANRIIKVVTSPRSKQRRLIPNNYKQLMNNRQS